MPIAQLLVEGDLDAQLLNAVRPFGSPTIQRSGNKGALAPRARELRHEKRSVACYLRDRDFDYEPPSDTSQPQVDNRHTDGVLGWRWCRHELESYLLEPSLVASVFPWDEPSYRDTLVASAHSIAYYTSARWILGLLRKDVDSQRLFSTRPAWKNEIKVLEDLSCEASMTFLLSTLHDWQLRITCPLDDELRSRHDQRAQALLTLHTADEVLLWHGGKDLLAALEPEIRARYRIDPKTFSHRIRDWIYDQKARALAHLPEWAALFRCIAAES